MVVIDEDRVTNDDLIDRIVVNVPSSPTLVTSQTVTGVFNRASLVLSLLTFLFTFNIRAEYRAHQYVITNKQSDEDYTIVSSLNPRAYLAYHGGSESIELKLVNTWLCPGYTGKKKPICKSPEMRLAEGQGEAP